MIAIIILNYNGWECTIECLESVFNSNFDSSVNVIVVDNKSSDGSIERIVKWARGEIEVSNSKFPELMRKIKKQINFNLFEHSNGNFKGDVDRENNLTIISADKNGGYAYGNNIGIKLALSLFQDLEYIWIINNDVVVTPDALNNLVGAYKNKAGLIGSTIAYYYNHHLLQGFGCKYNKFMGTIKTIGSGNSTNNINEDYIYNIDYIIGASLFISKDILSKIGLLCEDYFLYFEELDLCLRAKNKKIDIYCATRSIIYHKEGATIGSSSDINSRSLLSDYWYLRSQILFTKKFYPNYINYSRLSLLLKILKRISNGNIRAGLQAIKIFIESFR